MHEGLSKPRRKRWLRLAVLSLGFLAMGTGLSACYVAPYNPYRPYYASPGYYHPSYYGGYGYGGGYYHY